MSTVIAQFSKWPELGKVKTRIAKTLGDEHALQLHIDLTMDLLNKFHAFASADYQLWLSQDNTEVYKNDPGSLSQPFARFCQTLDCSNIDIQTQVAGDLGLKMHEAFIRLSQDYEQVIIIGSDCPSIEPSTIAEVVKKLAENEIVIVPAEDGGYVLIAMNTQALDKIDSEWLSDIKWGTSDVLAQTLKACSQRTLKVSLLPALWDVDTEEDYKRWCRIRKE